MPRAKNRVASRARRKKVIKSAKGYYGRKKNNISLSKDAFFRAGKFAYRDRKQKKRQFRSLWIIRINAAARENGLTYSEFIDGLKKKNVELDRKSLAHLALHEPAALTKLIELVKA
ncbi:MAG: 50S ribosomal protein L20 [Chitinispirillaceae bacterium]|jgi:large subunit ribosomal protein L20|nr:50S ribosomal protein L20 [Chitinispirillaceae bacterium]